MANTLNLGNGNWGVKKDSLLAYNSENGNFKPLPFDFTRASSATVVNKAGLIETVGSGEPRIDFSNDAKGALLLEPQRTNAIQWSDLFSASSTGGYYGLYWNAIITDNNTISPDGSLNASKVVRGTDDVLIRALGVVTASTANTTTLWAKKGNYDKMMLDIGDEAASTITLTDEWQRIETTTSSALNTHIDISMPNSASGDYIYIYGFQVEQGSYANSYIPTQGSAVTRSADVCNNGGNEQVINSTEGVLYAEISALGIATNKYINIYQDANNRILLWITSTGVIRGYAIVNSSGSDVFIDAVGVDATNNNKIALSWQGFTLSLFVNGIKIGNSTVTNSFSTMNLTTLDLKDVTNANFFYGNVKDVRVYNTALTDAELIALTK